MSKAMTPSGLERQSFAFGRDAIWPISRPQVITIGDLLCCYVDRLLVRWMDSAVACQASDLRLIDSFVECATNCTFRGHRGHRLNLVFYNDLWYENKADRTSSPCRQFCCIRMLDWSDRNFSLDSSFGADYGNILYILYKGNVFRSNQNEVASILGGGAAVKCQMRASSYNTRPHPLNLDKSLRMQGEQLKVSQNPKQGIGDANHHMNPPIRTDLLCVRTANSLIRILLPLKLICRFYLSLHWLLAFVLLSTSQLCLIFLKHRTVYLCINK